MARSGSEMDACIAAAVLVATVNGGVAEDLLDPESVPGDGPKADLLFSVKGDRYVLEHTIVESFEGQIRDGDLLMRHLDALRPRLEAGLPHGDYDITVPVGALGGVPERKRDAVAERVFEWVLAVAPGLLPAVGGWFPPESGVRGTPLGVPFEVSIRRGENDKAEVFLWRFAPDNMPARRAERMLRGLSRKCGKLAGMAAARTVLALEYRDLALASAHLVHAAAIERLRAEPYVPEYVVLVDTRMTPSALYLSRWTTAEGLWPEAPQGPWKVRDGRVFQR